MLLWLNINSIYVRTYFKTFDGTEDPISMLLFFLSEAKATSATYSVAELTEVTNSCLE